MSVAAWEVLSELPFREEKDADIGASTIWPRVGDAATADAVRGAAC